MDGHDLHVKLREYFKKRRQELLESFMSCTEVEKVRGQIKELDTTVIKLREIIKTTGDDDE